MALNGLLAPLNSTMLLVALPEVGRGVHVDAATSNWLVTAYLTTMALSLAVGGRMGDRFGRRRVIFVGLVGHGLFSVVGALAPTFAVLVLARVGMAASSSVVFPAGAALLRELIAPARRGRAFGTVSAALTLAAAAGPLIGGALVLLAGWRTIFWANVPVVACAFALSWWAVPATARTLSARAAVLRLDLLRLPAFVAPVAANAFSNLAMYTTLVAVPLITAARFGAGGEVRGLLLAALSAGSVVMAPIGGRVADRLGRRRPAVLGMSLAAAGLAAAALLGSSVTALGVLLAITGAGLGLSSAGLQTAAIEAVPPADSGSAAGLYSTWRYIGGVLGTGVSTFVFALTGPAAALTPLLLLLSLAALCSAGCATGIGRDTVARPEMTTATWRGSPQPRGPRDPLSRS